MNLAERIDRLESRAEIGELCSAYCIAVDQRDMEWLRRLCADDVVFESSDGGMNSNGIDEVVAMFDRVLAIRGPGIHWTHDRFVEFDPDDPDKATGIVLAHAETSPNKTPSIAALRYDDTYRRVNGQWRFAVRSLTFFYYMPLKDFADRFQEEKRFLSGDGWREADFPERTEAWQRWHEENSA